MSGDHATNGQRGGGKPELLAPAGGLQAGLAAFESGADAIYLGVKKFSARADANNFSYEELDSITAYAHGLPRPRRVFVAVNTLVLQRELPALVEVLGAIADIGVDAVIVQDLGVARVARQHFPALRLHSSTQLAVHDRAGVEAMRQLGFARVTLARELTLEELRDVAAVPGIEVEAFAHGALCYAYSGLCLFSSLLLGRSGNRGQCAYPCRDAWTVSGAPRRTRDGRELPRDPARGFAFSMKDLAVPDLVRELTATGVDSLKIEGRKKSPLYVAATVDYYRRLLDGEVDADERARSEADLQTVFARKWTSLYLRSNADKDVADADTVGHRGEPMGSVEAVVRDGPLVLVRFRTTRRLFVHDGLQIDLDGLGRPFGFAVDVMRLAGRGPKRNLKEAPAGAIVEVALPDDYPTIGIGAPIYCSSSQEVKQRFREPQVNIGAFRTRRALDVAVELAPDGVALRGSVPDAGVELERSFPMPLDAAKDPARVEEAVRGAMAKLGDTGFALRSVALRNPAGLFVPVSKLNEARRALATELQAALDQRRRERLAAATQAVLAPPAGSIAPLAQPSWSLKVDRLAYLSALEDRDLAGVEEVVVDIGRDAGAQLAEALPALAGRLGRDRIRLALPMVTRRWEERGLRSKIERLRGLGFERWQAANASAWTFLGVDPRRPGGALDLSADWPMYAMNREATRQLLEMGAAGVTLSPEDGLDNMRELLRDCADRATVVVYQDSPLFISESCPYATLGGECPGPSQCEFEEMEMTSSHGSEVIACSDRCRTVVVNREPLSLERRMSDLLAAGVRRVRADFVFRRYLAEEVRDLWRGLRAGRCPVRGHVANFDRGLA